MEMGGTMYCLGEIFHIGLFNIASFTFIIFFLFQHKNDLIAFNIISLLRFNTCIILSVFITE